MFISKIIVVFTKKAYISVIHLKKKKRKKNYYLFIAEKIQSVQNQELSHH